jgi:hypothetical protein
MDVLPQPTGPWMTTGLAEASERHKEARAFFVEWTTTMSPICNIIERFDQIQYS